MYADAVLFHHGSDRHISRRLFNCPVTSGEGSGPGNLV